MISLNWQVFWCAVIVMMFPAHSSFAKSQLVVYTVNYPLTYFAERIGGEGVEVVFPAPSGIDPAFWVPQSEVIRQYQKADLILLNGAGYAKWTKKVSLPMLRVVDTSRSFRDNLIIIETTLTHNHGPSGDHSHSGTAFTTWLDYSFAAQQAEAVFQAFARKMPKRKAAFQSNYQSLRSDLLRLDELMQKISEIKPGIPLFASHPIYQYMARRYRLNLHMVMWEPDADPGTGEWQDLKNHTQSHEANWMIWEDSPLNQSAHLLEEMGVKSLVFSPCFNRPESGDFLTVMEKNIANLQVAFE